MKNRPRDIDLYKTDFVWTANVIALDSYYLEQKQEAIKYARLMFDYTLEYFFGRWRTEMPLDGGPPSEDRRKKYGTWSDEFRKSVFWASCLGEWAKVKKLAAYPDGNCPVGRYEPKLFCYWVLVLAGVLRGEPLEKLKDYTNTIDKSRRKYYTLLLNMLRAILNQDEDAFNARLAEYLDYCDEHTFNTPNLDERVSVDGTFLINFAHHKGLRVEVPEKYVDRIVVLKNPKPCKTSSYA